MTAYRRHAVYFSPPAGDPLAAFGAAWLGWDAEAGEARAHPAVPGLPMAVEAITETPRKYGLHGTLKPPMRLSGDEAAFEAALAALAERTAPFEAPPLRLSRFGGFLALTPGGWSEPLADLAFACVRELDRFRAAPTEDELAKRRAKGLTERQEEMLSAWGYPYVGPEFRFHLTLTGWFETATADAIREALAPHVAPFCEAPLAVEDVAWFGEAEDGRFHLVKRFPLKG
ncbi:MAG: DUF1045 domain-containing protein [Pseudomonadota bacterium]